MVLVAIITSLMALVSGLVVIGSGKHFEYSVQDILRGRFNALIYTWVAASTMFSLAHFALLMEFGFAYNFGDKDGETFKWMLVHSVMSILFVLAHTAVKRVLNEESTETPRYLWGVPANV